jgi:MFS transporter, DHA2 family, multidrug resistance protein
MDTARIDADQPVVSLRTWAGFGLLCVGMFMAILDIQIVATSLPDIQSALEIDKAQMSWIQTSYLIAEVIAIPLTGLLTRALTMRWLFVSALVVFTIASAGCAMSSSLGALVAWRTLQGFAGGCLIPLVFSAVFVMFPARAQATATTIAGVLAVLAPTVGPLIGGWITSTYSWPWLFLINLPIGILVIALSPVFLPRGVPQLLLITRLDAIALSAIAIALAALEIGLKEAPGRGWLSLNSLGLISFAVVIGTFFVARTLQSSRPVVDLTTFGDRNFALGCALSFVLGMSLYGSVYLMPVFLVFVRGHDALETGQIMLVTGLAQLVTAPIAVYLESRVSARLLTGFGFVLLAVGVAMSANQTIQTDFDEMLLPQIVRGVAFMFCLLPPTRLALGALSLDRVPDASGLFNLMRNLGGAIGLALIDTVLYGRTAGHGEALASRLRAGDTTAATQVGIPLDEFARGLTTGIDSQTEIAVRAAVERAAFAIACNEAWVLLAGLTAVGLLAIPFCRPPRRTDPSASSPAT